MRTSLESHTTLKYAVRSLEVLALAGLLFLAPALKAQSVTAVAPIQAKAGDTVTARGNGIAKSDVDIFYLTDGKLEWRCEVVDQTATSITFKVPHEITPGRWAVMIHTVGKNQMIELPVKLTVT